MFDIYIQEGSRQFLRGPNIYSQTKSVLSVILDIGTLEEHPSSLFPNFDTKLLLFLPGLKSHRCSGGFINRVRKGTWMGHIVEHVALELQSVVTRCDSGFGRTREIKPSLYRMTIMTYDEKLGFQCMKEAIELVLSIVNQKETSFSISASLKKIHDAMELAMSSYHIIDKAYQLKLPCLILHKNLMQLNYGKFQKRVWKGYGDATSHLSAEISTDKHQTKNLISPFIRVPSGILSSVTREGIEEAIEFFNTQKHNNKKVVLKPLDSNNSESVYTMIESEAEIRRIFKEMRDRGFSKVLTEEMLEGTYYRILVIKNRIVGVLESKDEYVTGDGRSTIQELVDSQLNEKMIGDSDLIVDMSSSSFHPQHLFLLQKMGKHPRSVLSREEKVVIRKNHDFRGDVSSRLHPQTELQVITAVQMIGLDIAGVDLIVKDISMPLDDQDGGVCEINAKPSWSDHIKFPSQHVSIVDEVIKYHFPNFSYSLTSVLPIISLVGNISPDLLTQWQYRVLSSCCPTIECIGWATENGVVVQYMTSMETSFPLSSPSMEDNDRNTYEEAQKILIHPEVELAFFQANFEDIKKYGLPYTQSTILILDDIDKKITDALLSVVLDAFSPTIGLLLVKKGLETKRQQVLELTRNVANVFLYKDHSEMWSRIASFLKKK